MNDPIATIRAALELALRASGPSAAFYEMQHDALAALTQLSEELADHRSLAQQDSSSIEQQTYAQSFRDGHAAAIEEAAKVADKNEDLADADIGIGSHASVVAHYIAQEIRALLPPADAAAEPETPTKEIEK